MQINEYQEQNFLLSQNRYRVIKLSTLKNIDRDVSKSYTLIVSNSILEKKDLNLVLQSTNC